MARKPSNTPTTELTIGIGVIVLAFVAVGGDGQPSGVTNAASSVVDTFSSNDTHIDDAPTDQAPAPETDIPPPVDDAEAAPPAPQPPAPYAQGATKYPLETTYAQLEQLEVKGPAPMTGYSREEFGPAWPRDLATADGVSCDARNITLQHQIPDAALDADQCTVTLGVFDGPYSGDPIHFELGETSADVHVDHVVALGDSWKTGAQQWDDDTRRAFANDLDNLVAVDGGLNQQKGDSNAASWVPPRNRCDYIATQIYVKHKYGLWVTPPEKDALHQHLEPC